MDRSPAAHVSGAEYLSVARLTASNEAGDTWSGWVHGRLADHRRLKCDLRAALDDRFALSKADTASHLFVTATVLDPVTKRCELFPESLQNAAYDHVRALMSETTAVFSKCYLHAQFINRHVKLPTSESARLSVFSYQYVALCHEMLLCLYETLLSTFDHWLSITQLSGLPRMYTISNKLNKSKADFQNDCQD